MGRHDLILPLYYVTAREMSGKGAKDAVVDDILSRKYYDWRKLRHKPTDSAEVLQEFAGLAATMAETYFEMADLISVDPKLTSLSIEKSKETVKYVDSLLDREIDNESMIAYSVGKFPQLPVSPEWTRELLKDIDRSRYRMIRDIDKEFNYAKTKVEEYAKVHPELFKYSTDYITKTLIFVDSKFRRARAVSPLSITAALKAGLTRY